MLLLIILLPLIGSLFFLHIEESSNIKSVNTVISTRDKISPVGAKTYDSIYSKNLFKVLNDAKKNSIIKQIGLSTSLITLLLTIYLFICMNNITVSYQLTNYTLPLAVDGISIYYVLLTAFITPICLLSN
jgi:NADH:ubiquinone oxidoreductase subunit 4 (subunit M)